MDVKTKIIGGSALAILLLAIITNAGLPNVTSNEVRDIRVGSAVVRAEIVDTPETQARGLSGRADLRDGEGMLFIFDKEEAHGIWMKEIQFAIDILWASDDGTILTIRKNISPMTYPQVFYSSELRSRYVLEVPAGFADRTGVAVGDKIELR